MIEAEVCVVVVVVVAVVVVVDELVDVEELPPPHPARQQIRKAEIRGSILLPGVRNFITVPIFFKALAIHSSKPMVSKPIEPEPINF